MDLDNLPFDELRSLHTALAVPNGPAAPREMLRQADVGFHVEVHSHNPGELAMEPGPQELRGPVVVLSFR